MSLLVTEGAKVRPVIELALYFLAHPVTYEDNPVTAAFPPDSVGLVNWAMRYATPSDLNLPLKDKNIPLNETFSVMNSLGENDYEAQSISLALIEKGATLQPNSNGVLPPYILDVVEDSSLQDGGTEQDPALLKALLIAGASPNEVDSIGRSALEKALLRGPR